jgi:hypothetical protein
VSLLGFRRTRIEPDPAPTLQDLNEALATHGVHLEHAPTPQPQPEADETPCTCKAFDAIGQNPECPEHPWWAHDNDVLHLADLTRELGSALAAARATFGGQR